jgi:hypothetical protein
MKRKHALWAAAALLVFGASAARAQEDNAPTGERTAYRRSWAVPGACTFCSWDNDPAVCTCVM